MREITKGYDPHLLDFTRICDEKWEAIEQDYTARRWKFSEILPVSETAKLD